MEQSQQTSSQAQLAFQQGSAVAGQNEQHKAHPSRSRWLPPDVDDNNFEYEGLNWLSRGNWRQLTHLYLCKPSLTKQETILPTRALGKCWRPTGPTSSSSFWVPSHSQRRQLNYRFLQSAAQQRNETSLQKTIHSLQQFYSRPPSLILYSPLSDWV